MVNYQNGKIYKLYSPSKNLVYIGSTTQILCKRLVIHLSKYNTYNNDNTKSYYTSFLVLECGDYKIELLEEYACNNKGQLCKKEGEYIRNNECVNRCIAGRTSKEYKKENYEISKAYDRAYTKELEEKVKEYNKLMQN